MAGKAFLFNTEKPDTFDAVYVDDKEGVIADPDTLGEGDLVNDLIEERVKDPDEVVKRFAQYGQNVLYSKPFADGEIPDDSSLSSYTIGYDKDGEDSGTKALYDEWKASEQENEKTQTSEEPQRKNGATEKVQKMIDKMKSESKWLNSGYYPEEAQVE